MANNLSTRGCNITGLYDKQANSIQFIATFVGYERVARGTRWEMGDCYKIVNDTPVSATPASLGVSISSAGVLTFNENEIATPPLALLEVIAKPFSETGTTREWMKYRFRIYEFMNI